MWWHNLLAACFVSTALLAVFLGSRSSVRKQRGDAGRWQGEDFFAGLNIPPNQGSSGTGAFMPGVYKYQYSAQDITNIKLSGFSAIRLPVNIETSLDSASLAKLKEYIEAVDGRAVICMFGTDFTGDGHGTGKVDDVAGTASAWENIHETFASFPDVKYEIFNEPFGYSKASEYYQDMQTIISTAALPIERCILAGLTYESVLRPLVELGWKGDFGYHAYPNWLPDGNRTQEGFSTKIQEDLAGLSTRVWITEFGGALNVANPDYSHFEPSGVGGDVNLFRGLHDALLALKGRGEPVRGAFHWHGWHNGDSYDFWEPKNANGASEVRNIMSDMRVAVKALWV